jgi:Glycerophosphoryl diester phosphodiesterase
MPPEFVSSDEPNKQVYMKTIFGFLFVFMFQMVAFGQPKIIAHRGSSFIAPENTIASANLAWEQNADAVECDIHLTRDNRVMVMHDGDTKSTTGEDYKISETNSDVLRTLDAGSLKSARYKGEKIPFLSELIETVPEGKKLIIEIKCDRSVFPALKQIVKKSGKKKQLVFIAFDWETIVEAKKIFSKNECYWLSGSQSLVLQKWPEITKNSLDGINLSYKIIDDGLMLKAKQASIKVLSWTVDDPAVAKRLADLGVVAITTNKPDFMRKSFE